ncbi:hypothetical protein DsansV1_C07g0068551 [Dioscorea sansibarensis]
MFHSHQLATRSVDLNVALEKLSDRRFTMESLMTNELTSRHEPVTH